MEQERELVINLINFAWRNSQRDGLSLHDRLNPFSAELYKLMENSIPVVYQPTTDLWEFKN